MVDSGRNLKVLAMDFDGVIADSVQECAVASYNAFQMRSKNGKRVTSHKDINKELLNNFLQLRSFIRSGEDYVYIYHILAEKFAVENQAHFDSFLDEHKDLKEEYYTDFYRERNLLLRNNKEAWLKLNPLFPGMINFLLKNVHKSNFYIVSTKATEYITTILSFYGLTVDSSRIPHAYGNKTKSGIIADLIKKFNVSSKEVTFIDDHLNTLIKVKETGANCLLAAWGYNDPKQNIEAAENNIHPVELGDFIENYSLSTH